MQTSPANDSHSRRTRVLEQAHRELQSYALLYARKLCHGDEDLAKDIVQDAWMSLWESEGLSRSDGGFLKNMKILLFQHVEWRFIDMVRRGRAVRRGKGWEQISLRDIPSPQHGVLSLAQVAGLYRDSLRRAGVNDRRLDVFSGVAEGNSFQEVSDALGFSVATIRRDLTQIREKLTQIL